jgi:hypothetical protein
MTTKFSAKPRSSTGIPGKDRLSHTNTMNRTSEAAKLTAATPMGNKL